MLDIHSGPACVLQCQRGLLQRDLLGCVCVCVCMTDSLELQNLECLRLTYQILIELRSETHPV